MLLAEQYTCTLAQSLAAVRMALRFGILRKFLRALLPHRDSEMWPHRQPVFRKQREAERHSVLPERVDRPLRPEKSLLRSTIEEGPRQQLRGR